MIENRLHSVGEELCKESDVMDLLYATIEQTLDTLTSGPTADKLRHVLEYIEFLQTQGVEQEVESPDGHGEISLDLPDECGCGEVQACVVVAGRLY